MPRGKTVVITIHSWSLVSAKMSMNLPVAYKLSPIMREYFTFVLSIMNPAIVIPYVNRQIAEMQKTSPASEEVIPNSYWQYIRKVKSSIKKMRDVRNLNMKIIHSSKVCCCLNTL